MTHFKVAAALALAASTIASGLAEARSHRHHYGLPYQISYNHNYGPGRLPGTFAYYDGPSNNACAQGSATYRAQDRRRHPCF